MFEPQKQPSGNCCTLVVPTVPRKEEVAKWVDRCTPVCSQVARNAALQALLPVSCSLVRSICAVREAADCLVCCDNHVHHTCHEVVVISGPPLVCFLKISFSQVRLSSREASGDQTGSELATLL